MEAFDNWDREAPEVAAEPARLTEEQPAVEEGQPVIEEVQPVIEEVQPAAEEVQPAAEQAQPARKASPYADSPYVMNTPPSPSKPPKAKKKASPAFRRGLALALCAVALVASSCAITARVVEKTWEERSEKTFAKMRKELEQMQAKVDTAADAAAAALPKQGDDMTPAQLYAGNVDSVVAISVAMPAGGLYGGGEATSAGSGFIFKEDGYIITNHHVVEGASSILVTTNDGTEYEAALVGKDSTNDLAVLKVEATGLKAAALGSSNDLIIGDMVVAIGNPLGELNATQTVGYVSGINREVSTGNLTTISMIQTDAAINPGNSGGPLFNLYGQVVGITTAKYSGTTGSGASIEGIGFAIPIDDVLPLVDDIIDFGYVTGAYMAVTVQDVDAESAEKYGLPTGAYIVTVEEGGAADRAGIQPKDIVIALDEYTVKNVTELTRTLRKYKAGDTAEVTLIRGGKEMTVTIELDEKPQQTEEETASQDAAGESQLPDSFGSIFDFFPFFG